MRNITPKELIEKVPDIQSIYLPDSWFNNLSENKSVFSSLYEWMLDEGEVPQKFKKNLHNLTYVGEKIYKKLIAAEKKRLRKKLKLKSEELDAAVSWSDINSGPKTEIGHCKISGDCILVIPETSKEELGNYSFERYKFENQKIVNRIKNQAAGASFYQWLISQIERPDRVGDFARDSKADSSFPVKAELYQEIEIYLSKLGACSAAIESFKQSWLEYSLQYPNRIKIYSWCDECSNKFSVENTNFAFCEESLEVFILCKACSVKYTGMYSLKTIPLSQMNQDILEDLVDSHELSKFTIEETVEKLKLWGAIPQNEVGIIYFIKSSNNHEVKIGFTSGDVAKRMSTLQTSHPYKLELLATIPGDTKFESELHNTFQQHRLRGEWFKPHPDVMTYVSNIK